MRCAVNLDYAPKLKRRYCFGGFRDVAGNINTFNLLQRRSVEKRLDEQGNNSYDWTKFPESNSGCHEAATCSLMLRSGPRSTASPLVAGLSPSGLAKKSGLDPTTFNKSKRITPDGRARWPSTESVAKALAATGTTDRHIRAADRGDRALHGQQAVPLIGFRARPATAAISTTAAFRPARAGTRSAFPAVNDEHAYALEISGEFDGAGLPRRHCDHRVACRLRFAVATASWSRPPTAR